MTEKNEVNYGEASFKAFLERPEAAFLTKECLSIIKFHIVQAWEHGYDEGEESTNTDWNCI